MDKDKFKKRPALWETIVNMEEDYKRREDAINYQKSQEAKEKKQQEKLNNSKNG